MKSSIFIASGSGGLSDMSIDWRSFAIPEGLLVLRCWLALGSGFVSQKCQVTVAIQTYRACSLSLRLRFMAISRHDKFSIRSCWGNWFLVLA